MTIGEVVKRSAIHASAIRYYESVGILPKPQRIAGRRVYGEAIFSLLALVKFARSAGFSVKQIGTLTSGLNGGFSTAFQKLARTKINELDAMIGHAKQMKALLEDSLHCRCLTAQMCGSRILNGTPKRI